MLTDSHARKIALTDLDRSLLIEAGAGSGKTSLMAGRIVSLLAKGVSPSNIAAVTFTEMAAAELSSRVSETLDRVLENDPPADLSSAYEKGNIDEEGKKNLEIAQQLLGEMTCTTIHGFCKRLLKPYPVEADIDPGASILDPAQAALLFEDVFEEWVRDRLSGHNPHRDLITEMVSNQSDAKEAIRIIRDLASQLRGSPDLSVAECHLDHENLIHFEKMAHEFNDWSLSHGFEAEGNRAICEAFIDVANEIHEVRTLPTHSAIMRIARLEFSASVQKADGDFRLYRMKGKWQAVAPTKKDGERLNDEATAQYQRITEVIASIKANAAASALFMLRNELIPLLELYRSTKRAGAALDFEDLLTSTRTMLNQHPEIANSLGQRYRYILVDEFQDTDPVQAEIFLNLSFDKKENEWIPRPGAIFLVGDPKQGIYRFRGADVNTYLKMKSLIEKNDPSSILQISTNFRSSQGILSHVNEVFAEPLSADNQPGFTALEPFRDDDTSFPAVSTIRIDDYKAIGESRDEEARRIAEICRRLIGSNIVFDKETKKLRKCKPSDIALLTPTGTELWRYEHALEEEGISVATQAGKGMFQRQEVQDMIAITRVLADPQDNLALGALLRGPLVGLTENELLDASHLLPKNEDGTLTYIRMGLASDSFQNSLLRDVMWKLKSLMERSHNVTPHDILCAAVDELNVRATIRNRHIKSPNRALANIDRYLEMSRPYSIRGLRAFSDDMRALWEDGDRITEAHPDGEDKSISIITMHSAKGLEWPVVFTINGMTEVMKSSSMVVDVSSRKLTMPFFKIHPSNYIDAKATDEMEAASERTRLMYVAMTRARDLLVIPVHAEAQERHWSSIVDLKTCNLPELSLAEREGRERRARDVDNTAQDRDTFEKETLAIANIKKRVVQRTPSRHEQIGVHQSLLTYDEMIVAEPIYDKSEVIKGSAERGIVLHKLIEEILTGELEEDVIAISERSEVLSTQLMSSTGAKLDGLDHLNLANEICATLSLPDIQQIRERLVPEVTTMNAYDYDDYEIVENGIMDAVALNETGDIDIVVDWKSDRHADEATISQYIKQVKKYMKINGAERGAIVFTASRKIVHVVGSA